MNVAEYTCGRLCHLPYRCWKWYGNHTPGSVQWYCSARRGHPKYL